jgi:uncharacterized damage-inducible protein DinB
MNTARKIMIDLSNQECLGGSLNGPSLIETLRSLSPEEAASTETYEGYSAWSVALHVLYFKHMIGGALGGTLPSYDYEETDFPTPPEAVTQAAWDKVIADNEAIHKGFIDALTAASDEQLEANYAPWKMPLGKAVTWIISHDTNHNTQIRNMGLPSLRKPID